MSLSARIAGSAALADEHEAAEESGIYHFSADLHTADWIIRAEMTSPEFRLSDHLNGSSRTVDVRPRHATRLDEGVQMDLAGTIASLTKDRILLAIPIREPRGRAASKQDMWRPMQQYRCWAALGPYRLLGTFHVDAGRDPRVALRMFDEEFVAITAVSLSTRSGEPQQHPAVFINHAHLDLLAIKDTP